MSVALITGAARRIGHHIALELADEGYDLALCIRPDRADQDGEALKRDIESKGGKVVILPADLSDAGAVEKLIPDAVSALGPVSVLINNASVFDADTAATMTQTTWDEHMSVNLRAPAFLARALHAQLPASGGQIINMIDQRVWRPNPLFFSYTLSKMALWDMTRVMAQAFAPAIRVNAIGPGPTLQSIHQTEEDFAHEVASMPLQRGTTPQEICAAIRFILSSPAMTGQMIALDGGQHLAWATPDIVGIPK
ncbi:MAG: SDR family oxidoreductase [Parvibaculum sp.]|nr:SDR family oxidoreductase [Parvibaculum sp.]